MNSFFKKFFLVLFYFSLPMFACHALAQGKSGEREENHDWLKLYYQSNGINRIAAHPLSEIDSVEYRVMKAPADSLIKTVNIIAGGDIFSLPVDSIDSMILGGNIPSLYIDTDPAVDEITSKTDFIPANLRYVPYGDGTSSLEQAVSIRGRGNSSWFFPKKPYRLKFDKKQSLGGLQKAKSFVLLSNYIDNTLMRNAVAMKVARLIGMPYSNEMVPVNLIFNGKQRGAYMLTHKVGINSGSVDIDEEEGILWELDTNFDEEFKFRSSTFNLPCMVKDPDFHEITDDSPEALAEIWDYWREDLENAFLAVEQGNWREAFEEEDFINYFLVQDIVHNTETEFPKSFYIYKEKKDEKYKLGPCWDFDWAMGYHSDIERGVIYRNCGSFAFLSKIFDDEEFLIKFRRKFNEFCELHMDELMTFIDSYASLIRDSALADASIWPAEHFNTEYEHTERNTSHFDRNVEELKDWITRRIEVIRNSDNCSLY